MEVETYEVISLDEQGGDIINETVSEEALALIESLGLGGQKALVERHTADDGEEVETRWPYRVLTAEETNIFATLFPVRTPIAKYQDGPIPLRVLQVAAHAKEMGLALFVLHPENGVRMDDPVLVGERAGRVRTWERERFLLARWGDELVSLDELRAKAEVKLSARWRLAAEQARAGLHMFADHVDLHVRAFLVGQEVTLPTSQITMPAYERF
jgi:hypothetical protein